MSTYYDFKDRSEELFGRHSLLNHLLMRSNINGLTVIAGRPQIGKTWLLNQLGWIIENDGSCLIGYHDSKGVGEAHLLYAVADLYRRWLSSASIKAQMKSIYKRNKSILLPGFGLLLGSIFDELSPANLFPFSGAVKSLFSGLYTTNKDLKSGGMSLPELDYEKALSLVQVVHEESEKHPLILMLDAIEKTPDMKSFNKLYNTLNTILSNIDDWPRCHIFLGIRDPELHYPEINEQVNTLIIDLVESSPLAELVSMPPMNLENQSECQRLIKHVKNIAPGARSIPEAELLNIINGFPGVIERFRSQKDSQKVKNPDGLYQLAADAHKFRYREFKKLLPSLKGDELRMALRIAVFHGLDEANWYFFHDVLCDGVEPTAWEELRLKRVLENENFPTYGHDTRHVDALLRFFEMRPDSMRIELEHLVCKLAQGISFSGDNMVFYASALAGLQIKSETFGANQFYITLCQAATSLLYEENIYQTDHFHKALLVANELCPYTIETLCYAILIGAKQKEAYSDYPSAIKDYTQLFDNNLLDVEIRAAALYMRGLCKKVTNDFLGAIHDLSEVYGFDDIPITIRSAAIHNRGISKGETGDIDGAINDYTKVLSMQGVDANQRAESLYNRGVRKSQKKDYTGATSDYTKVIEMNDAGNNARSRAYLNRGVRRTTDGDHSGAISDYTSIIEMSDVSSDILSMAYLYRGLRREFIGDNRGSIADFKFVLTMEDAPVNIVYNAAEARARIEDTSRNTKNDPDISSETILTNRVEFQNALSILEHARHKLSIGELDESIQDLTTLIDMKDTPVEIVREALLLRSNITCLSGNYNASIIDYAHIAGMDGADADLRAHSLISIGTLIKEGNQYNEAIKYFTAVIEDLNVSEEFRAKALLHRGFCKGQTEDLSGAIKDFSTIIEMNDAPIEIITRALTGRGFRKCQTGDDQGELEDYLHVVNMDKTPDDLRSMALFNIGTNKERTGDIAGAIQYYTDTIDFKYTPQNIRLKASKRRSYCKVEINDISGAIKDYIKGIGEQDSDEDTNAQMLHSLSLTLFAYNEIVMGLETGALSILSNRLPDNGIQIAETFCTASDLTRSALLIDNEYTNLATACAYAFFSFCDRKSKTMFDDLKKNKTISDRAANIYYRIIKILEKGSIQI